MVASSVPSDGLLREIDVDLFHVEVFLHAPLAQLASDAALLVTAPGRLDVGGLHVVDPHDARAQILDRAHRAEDVARPDGGGESEVGVVGDAQRVLFAVERDDAVDRPENLLPGNPRGIVDVVEDRRLQEVAALQRCAGGAAAADRHFGFALADVLILAYAVELLAADERAHFRVAVERHAHFDGARLLHHRVEKALVDRSLDENAAAGRTDFALVEEDAEQRAFDRNLEIGVREEDVRRLAAELERNLLQRVRRAAHDRLADFHAAGESDLVDIGMSDDRCAGDFSPSSDNVDHAGRKAGVGETGRQRERGQRRLLRRLQHRRAAGADRRRELPRRHQQRVIPRHDLPGDADRLAQRQAHRIVRYRYDIAVNLGGQAAVILEASGDVGDVELGFDDRLAGVAGLQRGKLLAARANDFRQLEQHSAAVLRGRALPGTLVERRARGLGGAVDIRASGIGYPGHDLCG